MSHRRRSFVLALLGRQDFGQESSHVLAHDRGDVVIREVGLQQPIGDLRHSRGVERCCDRTVEIGAERDVRDADFVRRVLDRVDNRRGVCAPDGVLEKGIKLVLILFMLLPSG